MNRRLFLVFLIPLGIVALSAPLWLPLLHKPVTLAEDPGTAIEGSTVSVAGSMGNATAAWDLQVIVHDAETGASVGNAEVQVGEQQGRTDERGTFAARVAPGTLPVDVWSPGYERWQGQTDAAAARDRSAVLEVALEPNTVSGQVVGEDLKPLPAASVTFQGTAVPLDGEAKFVLRRVKAGDVITAEHPGYLPRQSTYDGGPTLDLALEAIPVAVNVQDAMTGQGVPGVSVCVNDDSCQPTDGEGKAVLDQVAPGTPIVARHEGYQAGQATYQGEEGLTLTIAPRELYGTIRDIESGQPITRAILFVNGQVTPMNEDGKYHLPDVTQVYSLFVKAPGYRRITIPMGPETTTSHYQALDTCLEPAQYPCADITLSRFAVHGIYINFGLLWNRPKLMSLIDLVDRSPDLNAIVLDVKGDFGYLAFESTDPIVASGDAMTTPRVPLSEFLQICKEKHIYTIARMVIFKDSPLIEARPELAVRHPNGAIFYDREGMAWADPTLPAVWEYNIAITKEVIRLGFDEVQYDYLRYPSDSTSLAVVRALVYSIPSTLESRTAAIQGFVKAAKAAVDPTPAFLSADMFGYALSVDPEHDMRIGQRLKDLAPYVDYVCPMVYPSTFIPGNLGLESPSDSPYEVVAISMRYGLERTDTLIRPWLQHYWHTRHDLVEQRRAAEEATDVGWCFWNAGGTYDELFFIPPEGIER